MPELTEIGLKIDLYLAVPNGFPFPKWTYESSVVRERVFLQNDYGGIYV